jgi:hypothetical protein
MKLTSLVLFGAGYVLGTKAGRERYEQITALARTAAANLEQKSARQRILEYADGGHSVAAMLSKANGSSAPLSEPHPTR